MTLALVRAYRWSPDVIRGLFVSEVELVLGDAATILKGGA